MAEQGASAQRSPADLLISTDTLPNPLFIGSDVHTPGRTSDLVESPPSPGPSAPLRAERRDSGRTSSSIPIDSDIEFSEPEQEDAHRTMRPRILRGRRDQRPLEQATTGGRTLRREATWISRTTERTISDSSEGSSRVRTESTARGGVDEDSDGDSTGSPSRHRDNQLLLTPVSSGVGVQRATLLETKERRGQYTEDIAKNHHSDQVQMVRHFSFMDEDDTTWSQFRYALGEAQEESKFFLVILEGLANEDQIGDLELELQGIKRLLRKQTSVRRLPSRYKRGLIFDAPFLPTTDISTARYIGVWIPDNDKHFAVLFDPRVNIVPSQGLDDDSSIAKNIMHHYRAAKRWSRYGTYHMWLVLDLYSSLYIKKWNERYEDLAEQVEKDRERIIRHFTEAPIALLSLSLHKEESSLLSLLELKRYQEAVFQRIDMFFDNLVSVEIPEGFSFRLQSMIHHEGLSQKAIDLLLKKVDDSINLLFNIVAVNEARTINRLTYLAFVFVPLSFATSVWGMTEFQINAKWVAAFALPLLFVTVVMAWVSNKLARKLDYLKVKRLDKKQNISAHNNV